jgi:hypothetical protein
VTVIGAGVEVALVLAGMGPRLLLVGALVVVVSAAACLALDLGDVVALAEWPSTVRTPRTSDGVEWRVGTLRMLLINERRTDGANRRLHELLVGLIDDHLAAEHGIDRALDAQSAAAIIGPELMAFVTSPDSARVQPFQVARLVTLIEDL